MAYNVIGGFGGGYNAYNIPSVKDNPHVAPVPSQVQEAPQKVEEKKESKVEKIEKELNEIIKSRGVINK